MSELDSEYAVKEDQIKIDKEELAPGLFVYRNVIKGYDQLVPYIEQCIEYGLAEWIVDRSSDKFRAMAIPYPEKFRDPNDFEVEFIERLSLVLSGFFIFVARDYIRSNDIPHKVHNGFVLMRTDPGYSVAYSEYEQDMLGNISVFYYLNEDYDGGVIDFPNLGVSYKPKANELILCPVGEGYEYSISEISNGTKYSVSSSISLGPDCG